MMLQKNIGIQTYNYFLAFKTKCGSCGKTSFSVKKNSAFKVFNNLYKDKIKMKHNKNLAVEL